MGGLRPLYTTGGNVNGAATLENSLAIPKMLNMSYHMIQQSTLRYISKRNKNISLHKNLYMNVNTAKN